MPGPYRVGIVGFGVAGATAAYLLARDGHRVTLLERAEQVGPIGAGVLLQISGQTVLQHLGIREQVVAHSAPIESLYARHVTGKTLIRTRYSDYEAGYRAYGVHRGVLFNALHDLVRTQAVEIRLQTEVVGREFNTSGETILIDHRGQRHGPFDFLIAADGSRSRMRELCGFRASILDYNHGTLWVTAPCPVQRDHLLQVVRGNQQMLGLLPLGDGLCSLYWGLPVRDFAQVKARGLEAIKAEILAFSSEAEPVLEFLQDIEQLIFTSYRHVHMRRFYNTNTLFIGDAAHAMSPHLGQGINLALVDAWRLAAALRSTTVPLAAFRAFRITQARYINYYATTTYLLSPFFQSDWAVLAWGRDLALPLMPRVPWLRKQMVMTVCGLKGGFFRGAETI